MTEGAVLGIQELLKEEKKAWAPEEMKITFKDRDDFVKAGTMVLSNIAATITGQLARIWADNPDAIEQVFLAVLLNPMFVNQIRPSAIPADGVEFELTLDLSVSWPELLPRHLAEYLKRENLTWRYIAPPMIIPQTRRFKLVSIGMVHPLHDCARGQCVFDIIKERLKDRGILPEPGWFLAFKEKYKPCGRLDENIAFPSLAWKNDEGNSMCLVLDGNSFLGKEWNESLIEVGGNDIGGGIIDPGDIIPERWRWLVEVR